MARYALVLTEGGTLEGQPASDPLLVKQFGFGWQAIASVSNRCDLREFDIGRDAERTLLHGMPLPEEHDGACAKSADRGDDADVERVRSLMQGPLTPEVLVSGLYALGTWSGAGGGVSLFRKRGENWSWIGGTGGYLIVDEMIAKGVPKKNACAFRPRDGACTSASR